MAAASANFRIFFAAAFLTGCNHSPLSSAAGWRAGEWPSDQQVTQGVQDESRRAGLEKLASMANADSRLWTVTPKLAKVDHGFGVEPTVATAQDLPPPRAKEYRALFSQLALPEGWVRENLKNSGSYLLFPISVTPTGGGDTVEKGLLFSAAPLDTATPDIELTRQEADQRKPALLAKRIEGNWYIYARYNE
jgi:hypothetical protein